MRSTSRHSTRHRFNPSFGPRLELLEDRCTPAILVTTLLDENSANETTSLREAIALASLSSGDDTITFAPELAGSINLSIGQLTLDDSSGSVAIEATLGVNTIDAGGSSRVIRVESGTLATLTGLTILGGSADEGAGIDNAGTLTLINSTVSGNSVTTAGGGIKNSGTMTLTDSTVSGNSAYHYYGVSGGGIHNSGTLTLTGSTVSGNSAFAYSYDNGSGGGIYNSGILTITGSTVANNTASAYYDSGVGGGIYNSGTLTLTNSAISGNSADSLFDPARGAGISNSGTMWLTNSVVSDNSTTDNGYTGVGGGIDNSGIATLIGVTVSDNSASESGGISNSGTMTLADSTVSRNSAGQGGGISNSGDMTLTDSMISDNWATLLFGFTIEGGGGIRNSGTMMLDNTHVVGNRANTSGGGILSTASTMTLNHSTVSNNSADLGGGIMGRGSMTLNGTEVSDNSADSMGGGIFFGVFGNSTMTLTDSTVSGNSAVLDVGGIFSGSPTTTVTLIRSTVSGNSAGRDGGGLSTNSDGNLDLVDSTVSGNSAGRDGGGFLVVNGNISLTGTTVSNNSAIRDGGGFIVSGTITLNNSIVANSVGSSDIVNVGGSVSVSFSLIEDGSEITAGVDGNIDGDPLLSALSENGGPTRTHSLLVGSPAINAGNNADVPVDSITDQRGGIFHRIFDTTVDMGSIEWQESDTAPPVITEGASIGVTMDEDGNPTPFSLTLNATDADGDSLQWSISSAATNGVASAGGTGNSQVIAYTPNSDFNGTDSFVVQVSDGNGGSDTITVNITINAINDAPTFPVGIDPEFDLLQSSVIGTVVGQVSATDIDGDDITYTITDGDPNGHFAIDANGVITVANPVGPVDSYVLEVTATDNGLPNLSDREIVTITVIHDVGPTVTIEQGATQADPVTSGPIVFDVVFSEVVNGFDESDIDFTGSTVGETLVASVTQVTPTTYTVSVTGMFGAGDVVASIPAGAATDAGGNDSFAASSIDNKVSYFGFGTVGLDQAIFHTREDDGTLTIAVSRTGGTDGTLSIDFAISNGTATAGSDYSSMNGTLSWIDGEGGEKTFTIDILPDDLSEGDETIAITLSNVSAPATTGLLTGSIVIAANDPVTLDPTNRKQIFADEDGDRITVKFGGKVGEGIVYLTNGQGPVQSIELIGTDAKTTLAIAVKKNKTTGGDGESEVGTITGVSLKTLNAKKVKLVGGLNLTDYLGRLIVASVGDDADIAAGGTPDQKTRIVAGDIGDGVDITLGSVLGLLKANSFGDGSIAVPSIGKIAIREDFRADVTASGDGVGTNKPVLGALKVKGNIVGSTIDVRGNINLISAWTFVDSMLLAGYTGTTPPDGTNGFETVATVKKFQVKGTEDAFANSIAIASVFKNVSLRSIKFDNGDNEFGFYADTEFGRVTAGKPAIINYRAGDFDIVIDDFNLRVV